MSAKRAVALISGGLDSMLATQLMLEQGIEVEGLNFFTGFCVEGHTHAIRRQSKPRRNNALWVAEQLGIKLHIIDIVEEYKQIVINPRYGYGANLNPCLDCKIFMVKKAKAWADEHGFDFIVTGEVIGQRPKSQKKVNMPVVAAQSGADDRLLRPLCAQHLAPTLPEQLGWVDRTKLKGFTGRSRNPQFELAKQFGFKDYSQPAGGCCFLTDKTYSAKLQDLWTAKKNRDYELDDIMLLKVGRHLRPSPDFKLIIGREEGENNYLEGYRYRFTHMEAKEFDGPLVLVDGTPSAEDLVLAARITARYGAGREAERVAIEIHHQSGSEQIIEVTPLPSEAVAEEWYI